MNKKKIIFLAIVGGLLLIFIVLLMISSSATKKAKTSANTLNAFSVWVLNDDKNKVLEFLEDFKTKYKYKDQTFIVEQFKNYEEYSLALASAIIRGQAPDIFMLNNNETSFLSENTLGIPKEYIDPDQFSDNFHSFFSDDLVMTSGEGDEKIDFLIGIPFGYETLGIIYNRNYIDSKDLDTWALLDNKIEDILAINRNIIPLGIGYGTSVYMAYDIATQFLMLDSVLNFDNVDIAILKTYLAKYYDYGKNYKFDFDSYKRAGITSVDGFLKGQVAMIIGYPSLIEKMSKNTNIRVEKSFLEAKAFPEESKVGGKALVNYNYFVLNKNTKKVQIGYDLLSYLYSEGGQKAYLDKFRYYLPARLSLDDRYLQKVINDSFPKIKLNDFYNNGDMQYKSFNKGIKSIYDKKLETILDDETNFISDFGEFKVSLKCKTDKIISLLGLSESCE